MRNQDPLSRLLDAGEPCPQPDDTSGWWIFPAIVAGAGILAVLAWWAPAAAGVLAVVCGAVVLWGM